MEEVARKRQILHGCLFSHFDSCQGLNRHFSRGGLARPQAAPGAPNSGGGAKESQEVTRRMDVRGERDAEAAGRASLLEEEEQEEEEEGARRTETFSDNTHTVPHRFRSVVSKYRLF